MKKAVFFFTSLSLGAFLFVLAMQQAGIENVANAIRSFPSLVIAIVFLLNFAAICLVGSLRWKIIIESQNRKKISFLTVFVAKTVGFAISYITPSALIGGEPVRAYIIKEETDYGWEKAFASVVIDQAIYFFVLFLFMIAGFLLLVDHFSLPVSVFYGFGTIIFTAIIILYLFYFKLLNRNKGEDGFFMFLLRTFKLDNIKCIQAKKKNINKTEKIISNFFKGKTDVLLKALALAVLEVVFYLAIIIIMVFSLNSVFNLMNSIYIFFLLTFANFVPIPGSFGSFEASLTFIFELLGLGKSSGFTFSLIYRFVNILLVIVGFVALAYFELKTISHSFSIEAPEFLLKIHRVLLRMLRK